MLEITGNIWEFHSDGEWIAITTNGIVGKNGAIMGAGIALEAKKRYPDLSYRLARHLNKYGNTPCAFKDLKIVTIPTKYHWRDKSDLDLIWNSCYRIAASEVFFSKLYLPRLGCGNGQLEWETVKEKISPILSDKFIVVTPLELHNQ